MKAKIKKSKNTVPQIVEKIEFKTVTDGKLPTKDKKPLKTSKKTNKKVNLSLPNPKDRRFKNENLKRDIRVTLLFNKIENEALIKKAIAKGLNVSDYIRLKLG